MKLSLNWVKQYLDFELLPVDELVDRIGAQLGAVEGVENLGEKYQGVIVVKVVECKPHADSDHLKVCKIDDGGKTQAVERDEHGYIQVVCGAPNVREGLLVAWLPPGSTVPESIGKDPFVLGSRELRGVMSNGMLASARELALSDNHDGILEIDEPDAKPGDDFAKLYGLDDFIIDIENKMFTHRPDCFGQLGVAREIAGISGQQFTSPDWYMRVLQDVLGQDANRLPLEVQNEVPELIPRFMAIVMSNIEVKPSPLWLQTYLQRVGLPSINNVVDITNYLMLLTGQPTHAYDYDKLHGATYGARLAKPGEKITLLNHKTYELHESDIVIVDGAGPIGLGGVMGGLESEVTAETKNIVLECVTFDMYTVRRTSMRHGIFSDAVTRYNKGQSPLQNDRIIAKGVAEIRSLIGGKVASELIDISKVEGRQWVHPPVPVSAEFINSRLGFELSADEMKKLLENVEFAVTTEGSNLTVTAPFWRTDIETREDVVEEIGRLHGFDKLPLVLPRRSIKPAAKDALLELKQTIRTQLAKAGANEVLTYSFVHGDLMDKVGQDKAKAFGLSNALSPDLQYYRLSLLPSLLTNIHPNVKAGYDEFALFELGKAHDTEALDEAGLPVEFDNLALVYTAVKPTKSGAAYYEACKFLTNLAARFGQTLEFVALDEHVTQSDMPFELDRSALIRLKGSSDSFGVVGEFNAKVRKNLKLPERTAGFELGIGAFMNTQGKSPYVPLPRFPKITQDITLKVAAELPYQKLFEFIGDELAKVQPPQTLPSLQPIDIYQADNNPEYRQITLRLTIASYQKTMTDTEVNQLLEHVTQAAKEAFGAERI